MRRSFIPKTVDSNGSQLNFGQSNNVMPKTFDSNGSYLNFGQSSNLVAKTLNFGRSPNGSQMNYGQSSNTNPNFFMENNTSELSPHNSFIYNPDSNQMESRSPKAFQRNFSNNPYDSINSPINSSQQNNVMPNFLIGNNNIEKDPSKFRLDTNQTTSQLDMQPSKMIKRQLSVNQSRYAPPINSYKELSSKKLMLRPLKEISKNEQSFISKSAFNPNNSIRNSDSFIQFSELKGDGGSDNNQFENWVTVYGFGSNHAQTILQYFKEIGTVTEEIISNTGNWMHLHYDNKMHAVAALSKNGRIIQNLCMIAVKICDDKIHELPCMANSNDLSFVNRSISNVANNNGTIDDGSSKLNRSINNVSMRSLIAPKDPLANDKPAPRKGMLHRAMSMVWGK